MGSFAFLIVLYQGARHIDTEAVAAHVQPESHDIFHRCQRCLLVPHHQRTAATVFPDPLIKAVVQGRLVGEEVDGASAVTLGNAAQASIPSGASHTLLVHT